MAEHIVPVGQTITLTIYADQEYSVQEVAVNTNEQYEFSVDPADRWKDSKIPSSARGFFNIFAWIAGLRVKGVKCFCLCACIGKDDTTAFPIGLGATKTFKGDGGMLSFFANDTRGYYHNNHGSVQLKIKRIV